MFDADFSNFLVCTKFWKPMGRKQDCNVNDLRKLNSMRNNLQSNERRIDWVGKPVIMLGQVFKEHLFESDFSKLLFWKLFDVTI